MYQHADERGVLEYVVRDDNQTKRNSAGNALSRAQELKAYARSQFVLPKKNKTYIIAHGHVALSINEQSSAREVPILNGGVERRYTFLVLQLLERHMSTHTHWSNRQLVALDNIH